MKLSWRVLFCLTLICPSLLAAEQFQKYSYKIGAILPLSGPMAFAGREVQNAINLSVSHVQSAKFQMELIFEDNARGGSATASAARKLIDVDNVDAIITLWPESANVAAPIAERKGVLHYTIAWDPQIACSNELTFSHQVMVNEYARATLELLRKQAINRVAFFHDSVFQQGADIILNMADKYDLKIEERFVFDRGKIDFRAELAKTRAGKADGMLIWSIMPETEVFLKQAAEQQVRLFITGFFDVVQNLDTIEGMPFPSEVFATSDFQEKFKRHFGQPAVMKGPNAYDVIQLLAKAVEPIGPNKPSPAAIKEQLLKVKDHPGAVGIISIDQCGNSYYPIIFKVVRSGKLTIIE